MAGGLGAKIASKDALYVGGDVWGQPTGKIEGQAPGSLVVKTACGKVGGLEV